MSYRGSPNFEDRCQRCYDYHLDEGTGDYEASERSQGYFRRLYRRMQIKPGAQLGEVMDFDH